jgi:tRNA pseudouridine13 synthase
VSLPDWPRAHGAPVSPARLRAHPEDFQVDEQLPFTPDGAGEHLLLHVRKRGQNTEYAARRLAQYAGLSARDISYAGLKDRQAVTTQWFSLHMGRRTAPDWRPLAVEGIEVLEAVPHGRKLRRGALRGNHFVILLREFRGEAAQAEIRLRRIAESGVPNYFGEQRFGRQGGNLDRARELLAGNYRAPRHERGILLSAARSELFNRVLAVRVQRNDWDQAIAGDVMMLAGSHSLFRCPEPDAAIVARLAAADIHPTGPLWGRGESMSSGACQALEAAVLGEEQALCSGLLQAGLDLDRRALRVMPEDLRWDWPAPEQLRLEFGLPAGAYATAVLRELAVY